MPDAALKEKLAALEERLAALEEERRVREEERGLQGQRLMSKANAEGGTCAETLTCGSAKDPRGVKFRPEVDSVYKCTRAASLWGFWEGESPEEAAAQTGCGGTGAARSPT